jgi:hypothetical protein
MTQDRQSGAAPAAEGTAGRPAAGGSSPGGDTADISGEVAPYHDSHGHSVAAWTAVGIVLVGSLVMSLAVAFAVVWLFIVGAVVAVAGGVAGKVMTAMGYGAEAPGARGQGANGVR